MKLPKLDKCEFVYLWLSFAAQALKLPISAIRETDVNGEMISRFHLGNHFHKFRPGGLKYPLRKMLNWIFISIQQVPHTIGTVGIDLIQI